MNGAVVVRCLISLVIAAVSVSPAAAVVGVARGEDLQGNNVHNVQNPSFEDAAVDTAVPLGWQGDPQVYSTDRTASHAGSGSLKYVNTDPGRYVLCTQQVALRGGWKCRVSAWVKTDNIVGEDSGATVCLE